MLQIPPSALNPTGLDQPGHLPGLDLVAYLQVLLVKEYDDQLKELALGMKSKTKVKKAYRKDIQALQQILLGKTVKIDDKEYVVLEEKTARETVNFRAEYSPHFTDSEFTTRYPGKDTLAESKKWPKDKDLGQRAGEGWVVQKEKLQNKIDKLNEQLEYHNEQSELTSLQLQTLTNQRKIAFETLSNLINKEGETLNTIGRNLKG